MSLHVRVFFFKFGLQIRLYQLKHLHFLRDGWRFLTKIESILGLIKSKKKKRNTQQTKVRILLYKRAVNVGRGHFVP